MIGAMRVGKVQLDQQSVYAILAVVGIVFAIYMGIPLPFIGARNLLFLTIIFLLARAFLPIELTGYLLFLILLAFIVYSFFPFPQLIFLILLILFLFGFFSRR